ncbi:MAG: FAD-dependent oxidoreductase, partial [Bacteroidota bacterium]
VIAGGGSVGVEVLGELLRYREAEIPFNIQVVEAQDRLLPGFSPKVNKEILRLCEDQQVNFHFGSRIEEVTAKTVKLSSGETLFADLCIWTAGVKPNPLLFEAGLSDSEFEYAAVYPNLQSEYDPHIFVAGDAADLGSMDSKQAFFAMESGEKAADNVLRFLAGKPLRRFFKIPRPYLYSFGDFTCFMIFKDLVLAGKPLLLLKESIFRITIEGIRAGNSCQSILKMVDKLFPKYLKDARSNFRAFIKNPIKFVLKPPVSIL